MGVLQLVDKLIKENSGEDAELKKYINDFKALYLNSKVEFNPQFVACGTALVIKVLKS